MRFDVPDVSAVSLVGFQRQHERERRVRKAVRAEASYLRNLLGDLDKSAPQDPSRHARGAGPPAI